MESKGLVAAAGVASSLGMMNEFDNFIGKKKGNKNPVNKTKTNKAKKKKRKSVQASRRRNRK